MSESAMGGHLPKEEAFGCKACKYQYFSAGDTQCRLRPHDFATNHQRQIVKWLSTPLRQAWTDAGCPGFER